MDHVTRVTSLSGMTRRLTFDIARKYTKFDDSSFSRSMQTYFKGVKL